MARTRKIKVHSVNLDVDETSTHWLVYVSPQIYAQSLGIAPHRAKLAKCVCPFPGHLARDRCSWCGNWHPHGLVNYTVRLLRSYPKQTVEVEAVPRPKQVTQQMPSAMRWSGPVRGWVVA